MLMAGSEEMRGACCGTSAAKDPSFRTTAALSRLALPSAGDPAKDVAVLQLEAPAEVLANLKPVSVGASSSLVVGQKVFAIGNPFGLDHSLSSGIISGLNRELNTGYGGSSLRNVIQCDAAINPGNSGGPLLDSRGRLIGINTAIADPTGKGASSGIGFALPIDTGIYNVGAPNWCSLSNWASCRVAFALLVLAPANRPAASLTRVVAFVPVLVFVPCAVQ
jgi:hypothetical protein